MRFIRLLIEYDGANYHGWQSQKEIKTIQSVLKKTVLDITGEEVRLTGASRTDAGVHALGQVAVFSTDSQLSDDVIRRALNAKLPVDIRIIEAADTDPAFSPRFDALKKSYFYIVSEDRISSVFLHRYSWHVHQHLELDGMLEAASFITGEHDFSCFRAAGCSSKTPVRRVCKIEIERTAEMSFMSASVRGSFIRFRLEADAFLRHMVRNIVGTLVEVGKNKLFPENVEEIMKSRDRTLAGPTAPAHGLFLEEIFY